MGLAQEQAELQAHGWLIYLLQAQQHLLGYRLLLLPVACCLLPPVY